MNMKIVNGNLVINQPTTNNLYGRFIKGYNRTLDQLTLGSQPRQGIKISKLEGE